MTELEKSNIKEMREIVENMTNIEEYINNKYQEDSEIIDPYITIGVLKAKAEILAIILREFDI